MKLSFLRGVGSLIKEMTLCQTVLPATFAGYLSFHNLSHHLSLFIVLFAVFVCLFFFFGINDNTVLTGFTTGFGGISTVTINTVVNYSYY